MLLSPDVEVDEDEEVVVGAVVSKERVLFLCLSRSSGARNTEESIS